MPTKKADPIFFWLVLLLTLGGFFIFTSASLGLLARESGAAWEDVFRNQVFLGLFGGLLALFVMSIVDYRHLKRFSLPFFIVGLIATAAVFIPSVGFEHGGARRWIDLGPISFQPTEILKLGFVIFFASWIAVVKDKVKQWKRGLLPLLILLGMCGILILLQPDTGTFGVLAGTGVVMFFAAGGKLRHIFVIFLLGILALGVLAFFKPYLQERIMTFINPGRDSLGSGYQAEQALIAIGSGGIFGRGFGQSIQKFNYLPEPTNDAIFAVAAEEFGFVGGAAIIIIFLLFCWRGLYIANRTNDTFGKMLVIGIVFLVIIQVFINIASMLSLFPLTGVPLLFISHGGTALFMTLLSAGIVLNVSRGMRH
ncbi:putative lipid II flippase FtsW [bacterium]|nr:putative lipid II flippase FtsW [bacterium]